MRSRLALLAWLAVAAGSGPARAQGEGYRIRLKERGAGDTLHVVKDETLTESNRIAGPTNQAVFERTTSSGEVTVYRETILVQPKNGPPTRLRRTYQKALMRDNGRVREQVYHSRTVLIERKGNRYAFWLEGRGELTAAEAKLLDKEFNSANERFTLANLLPPGPVRAGDYAWPVDIKPLVRDLQRTGKIGADLLKSKGVGRMKRVYRDDLDRVCAELHYELEFPITMLHVAGQKTPMGPGSRGIVTMTIDLCIDGSAYYVANKDSMRIEAATGYKLPDGAAAILSIQVLSDNTCVSREEPR